MILGCQQLTYSSAFVGNHVLNIKNENKSEVFNSCADDENNQISFGELSTSKRSYFGISAISENFFLIRVIFFLVLTPFLSLQNVVDFRLK